MKTTTITPDPAVITQMQFRRAQIAALKPKYEYDYPLIPVWPQMIEEALEKLDRAIVGYRETGNFGWAVAHTTTGLRCAIDYTEAATARARQVRQLRDERESAHQYLASIPTMEQAHAKRVRDLKYKQARRSAAESSAARVASLGAIREMTDRECADIIEREDRMAHYRQDLSQYHAGQMVQVGAHVIGIGTRQWAAIRTDSYPLPDGSISYAGYVFPDHTAAEWALGRLGIVVSYSCFVAPTL